MEMNLETINMFSKTIIIYQSIIIIDVRILVFNWDIPNIIKYLMVTLQELTQLKDKEVVDALSQQFHTGYFVS